MLWRIPVRLALALHLHRGPSFIWTERKYVNQTQLPHLPCIQSGRTTFYISKLHYAPDLYSFDSVCSTLLTFFTYSANISTPGKCMHSKREKETLQQPSNTFSIMELDVRPQTASTNEASGFQYLRERL